MGAKAWFIACFDSDPKLVLANKPELDRDKSIELVRKLFPAYAITPGADSTLAQLAPDDHEVFVGWYPGLRIIAHAELGIDHPSRIDPRWLDPALGRSAYVHATHSAVDWFAFGLWQEGRLVRSLSLSVLHGITEQIGAPLPFEAPYWAGQHPVQVDVGQRPYRFPFHPLELAEESLLLQLGFQFEGIMEKWVCDPDEIAIATISLVSPRPWWKLW